MIDLGISKLALIGIVALIVIGPERLPRVARTVGAFVGKAQRYVNEVKAEVNRSMDLDDIKKMRQEVEDTARQVQGSVKDAASDFERSWKETEAKFDQDTQRISTQQDWEDKSSDSFVAMRYVHPKKNWRLKRSAVPTWYKRRSGLPTKALSGAARVAKHKPKNTTRSA